MSTDDTNKRIRTVLTRVATTGVSTPDDDRLIEYGLRVGFQLPKAYVVLGLVYRYGDGDLDPISTRDIAKAMLGWDIVEGR